ncbi:unnamed protein product, partial [Brassica rapa subsp. trilocularis]
NITTIIIIHHISSSSPSLFVCPFFEPPLANTYWLHTATSPFSINYCFFTYTLSTTRFGKVQKKT